MKLPDVLGIPEVRPYGHYQQLKGLERIFRLIAERDAVRLAERLKNEAEASKA